MTKKIRFKKLEKPIVKSSSDDKRKKPRFVIPREHVNSHITEFFNLNLEGGLNFTSHFGKKDKDYNYGLRRDKSIPDSMPSISSSQVELMPQASSSFEDSEVEPYTKEHKGLVKEEYTKEILQSQLKHLIMSKKSERSDKFITIVERPKALNDLLENKKSALEPDTDNTIKIDGKDYYILSNYKPNENDNGYSLDGSVILFNSSDTTNLSARFKIVDLNDTNVATSTQGIYDKEKKLLIAPAHYANKYDGITAQNDDNFKIANSILEKCKTWLRSNFDDREEDVSIVFPNADTNYKKNKDTMEYNEKTGMATPNVYANNLKDRQQQKFNLCVRASQGQQPYNLSSAINCFDMHERACSAINPAHNSDKENVTSDHRFSHLTLRTKKGLEKYLRDLISNSEISSNIKNHASKLLDELSKSSYQYQTYLKDYLKFREDYSKNVACKNKERSRSSSPMIFNEASSSSAAPDDDISMDTR
ncbi:MULTISPECIES: hypothetical protein [Cysteiniphilum]|uniref:hypothetical protein n=1 Tax=Cysteiniphilum TaxID=2056696 RepID=UPI001780F679|nr:MULTISPECIES: hypothetical protein [Cysteiniphilum]